MADCIMCGKEMPQRRGRKRRTCSAACRQAAYRSRKNAEVAVLRAAAGAARATTTTIRPAAPRSCPIAEALLLLGERWTLLAVREIAYDVHRFEQIVRYTGASRDVLADRLRKLEDAGVVERRQYSQRPPRFEYHLTTGAGEALRPVLLSLAQWGRQWAHGSGLSSAPPTDGPKPAEAFWWDGSRHAIGSLGVV
jgi:DNA-binding HxlR family transcriptional regulator